MAKKKETVIKKNIVDSANSNPHLKSIFGVHNVHRLQWIIIVILPILLYVNTLSFDYTLDDLMMIKSNEFTVKGLKWEGGIKEILFNDAFAGFLGKYKNLLTGGRYRPLSQIMFAAEYQLFGEKPFWGHLLNVVFYAIASVLVFYFLKLLITVKNTRSKLFSIPFVASLIFIAHPIHTEVVANIKGRDEILSLFFSIITVILSIRYIDKKNPLLLFVVTISFFLAMLSKENGATFFAIIPLTIYFIYKPKFKAYLPVIFSLSIAVAGYLVLRYYALGYLYNEIISNELLNDPFLNATTAQKYATIFLTFGIYLKLLFFPHPLTHDYYPYHIELTDFSNIIVWLIIAIIAFMVYYAVKTLKQKSYYSYGILFFIIIFSISSNLFINIGAFMNERFVFIPLLGFAIIVATFFYKIPDYFKNSTKTLRVGGFVVFLLIAYSAKTITRNYAWENDTILFTTDVKVSSNSAKCNTSAAGMLIEKAKGNKNKLEKNKDLNLAIKYLNTALNIHQKYSAAWVLMGNAYIELNDFRAAKICYENAIAVGPGNKDAMNNLNYLGQKLAQKKDYETAMKTYKMLLENNPGNIDYSYEIASIYLETGKVDSSIFLLNEILLKDSMYYRAYCKLGEVYGKYLNQIEKSQKFLEKSLSIEPNDVSSLENMGIVFGVKKDYKHSIEYFLKALKEQPQKKTILENLAITYQSLGQKEKADSLRLVASKIKDE